MLVSHVITRLILGGAQENVVATVLGLQSHADYEVELISGPTSRDQTEGSIQHLVEGKPGLLTLVPDLVRPVSPLRDFRAFSKLRRHFQRRRPEIVHTHSGKAGILGRLAARVAGVPQIIHTIHGPSFGSFQGFLPNLVFRTAERIAGIYTTRFVSVAEAMRQQYLRAGIGRAEEYTKIFSGFDLRPFLEAKNDFSLRERLGIEPDAFVIGKVGRLFELKGHDDLLAVAPQIFRDEPKAKILLIGGGEWRERFEGIVRERGIREQVIFTGLVSPEEVASLIGIMDVVVHLSRREGLPRVIPQSLAAGKPVVAMDSDGAGEVCRNGETGYLIPVGDTAQLAAKILHLARKAELRERFGRQGRLLVEKEFAIETMVSRIIALYDEVTIR
ncbi:MAG: N-acetyl-alpha-D-glucosaminyl L-malate synthase [Verrucomicrobia subdivision 3 bacterium]|nr:N-acetyl-alpha-D-glucosaminyl L-malate synthase [Limisphaerales bacterium]MCS1416450.1 N-acetyl-alpha-D-glucosaminyl L-malate synthase [Limisphaerales bacterium]